jgi:transcriptional enhancer factor
MGTSTAHGSTSGRSTTGKTQDVFQKIVNNRKSYKMLKGAAEAVWPPHLEETLLKGTQRSSFLPSNETENDR